MMTMTTWTIENTVTGLVLGSYPGETREDALNAMSRDAGYRDHEQACAVAPVQDGELRVTLEAPTANPTDVETSVEWSDRMGHRSRTAWLILRAPDGALHRFQGDPIPGVARGQEIGGERDGKWSYTLWRVRLAPGVTVAFSGHGGWERGSLSEAAGVESYAALAAAWGVTEQEARRFIAAHSPRTARELAEGEAQI